MKFVVDSLVKRHIKSKFAGVFFGLMILFALSCGGGSSDSGGSSGGAGGSTTTADTTAPTAGTAISFSGISATGLSVNWGAATDDVTAQSNLEYKVVKDNALAGNIDTIAEVDAKTGGDLLQDYTANITTKAVTGLTASTTYHFAVVVRDAAGNKTIYTPASQTTSATPDVTPPTVGTAISFSSVASTTLSINWGAATDVVTPQANLEYRVVKDNAATANIDTVAEVDAKSGADLLQDYTANITTKAVTALTASTTYHFAVVVRDAAGNKSIYTPASQATSATTPPAVTNVVVASTNPNNGTTPYNTGTATLTLTGTAFTGATAVKLDDAAVTNATSFTVDSATQITATFPNRIRTNGNTGWNVQVTTPDGTNATSTVTFKPVTGLVINEVIFNDGGTAANDAVEIYNLTATSLDLSLLNANLQRDSACVLTGGVTSTLSLTGTIAANGYYVITPAASSFVGSAQQTTMTSFASGDCLGLTVSATAMTSAANTVFDFVAIGRTGTDRENSSYTPGSTATGIGAVSRCANGVDTNVNATDFLFRGPTGYTLGAANSCGNDPRNLKINEVAWNTTAAAGDMIEIYNSSGSSIDLGLAGVVFHRDGSCTIAGGAAAMSPLDIDNQ